MLNKEEFTKDTKHNWFSANGDIRLTTNMTTEEFADLLFNCLREFGADFLGSISYSEITDEDYETEE